MTTCILPFREWRENFVTVHFDIEGDTVTIKSKLNDGILFSTKKQRYIDVIKENQNKILLGLYREYFDLIQYQFNELVNNSTNGI